MQDDKRVALPASPVAPTSTQAPLHTLHTTWPDFQKLHSHLMSMVFRFDPRSKQVIVQGLEAKRTIAKLTDRLQGETEEDFIQFTQKKLDDANIHLEKLQEEFEGSLVGGIYSRLNEYSQSMNVPQFEQADLVDHIWCTKIYAV